MEQAQYTLNNSPPQGRPGFGGEAGVKVHLSVAPHRKLPKYVVQEPNKCCHLAQSKFIHIWWSFSLTVTCHQEPAGRKPHKILTAYITVWHISKDPKLYNVQNISTLEWYKKTCQHEEDRPPAKASVSPTFCCIIIPSHWTPRLRIIYTVLEALHNWLLGYSTDITNDSMKHLKWHQTVPGTLSMYQSVVRLLGWCSSLGPARHAHGYKYIQWLYVHFMVARIRIHLIKYASENRGTQP